MEEENKGITLKDIFKTIWVRKWVALIVAVLVVLVCAVSINYIYNPRVRTCEVEFSLNLPGSDTNSFYSYPDGKLFYYTDLTSVETLEKVKEDGNFENINVAKMVKNRDIGITRDVTVTPLSTDGKTVYRETVYKISAKTKYFSDTNEARDFLACVANYPTEYLEHMEIDYNVYLPLAKKAATDGKNDTAVEYLKEQLKFLSGEYEKLTGAYGETFVVGSGKTLLACAKEIAAYSVNAEDLEASITTVENFTTSFRTTSKAVYAKATTVAFTQPSIIVVSGGLDLIMIVIVSLVLGVVKPLIAAYVAGYLAIKKKQASAETAVNDAQNEQPAAEAEVTEKQNKK